jgi:hypothetical protein
MSMQYATRRRFSNTTCTVRNVNITVKPCCNDEELWHRQSSYVFNETQKNVSRRYRRRGQAVPFRERPSICHPCYCPSLIVEWNTPKRPMEIVNMDLYGDETRYLSAEEAITSGKQHVKP